MGIEKKSYQHNQKVAQKSEALNKLFFLAKFTGSLLLLSSIARSIFSGPQRNKVNELYGYQCQYPGCDLHLSANPHVHHISPESMSKYHGMQPEHLSNAMPLCENHHIRLLGGIHPDNVIAYYYYNKELPELRKMIEANYSHLLPCLEFFEKKARAYDKSSQRKTKSKQGKLIRKDAYHKVLREWRNAKMKKGIPYWNSEHDAEFQIKAVKKALYEMKKDREVFPLKNIHTKIRTQSAIYVWDNITNILLENYLLSLRGDKIKRILMEMRIGKRRTSREVYLKRLYEPAIKGYKKRNIVEKINKYITSLSDLEYARKAKLFNNSKKREDQLEILLNEFYYPSFSNGRKKKNKTKRNVQKSPRGLRTRI